ncbi:regulatory protein, luxR family [Sinosporangium album]|uniref:Regulatory protein, luxR family n=1 Tax=Sinosporangium album TaxID=504805 RepID=A0A1G7YQB5_9ACTN|nr:LuxR family transcriptional regulator [Sinosporangium album]SDG98641.1 regulatory protein, luxR family [Sinosporangium album]
MYVISREDCSGGIFDQALLGAGNTLKHPESIPTLIGRDVELGKLSALAEWTLTAGQGGSVTVTGGPGMGKTRLLEEVSRAAQSDFTVLWCCGAPSEVAVPFAGLHQILHPLQHRLKYLPDGHAAALNGVFGLSEPPKDRLSLPCATLALLTLAAEQKPLLLVIDDVQQLDEASLDSILFVSRRLYNVPVLVLIAAREHEPTYGRLQGLPEIRLSPLSPSDVGFLIKQVVGDLADPLVDRIIHESSGNPLVAIEIAASLAFSTGEGADMPDGLPCSVRLKSTFGRLISDLPDPTKRMLLIAAANDKRDVHTTFSATAALGIDTAAFAPAERSMVATVVDDELIFHPPFLRTIVYSNATFGERKTAHRALANATATTPYRHAYHLAAATYEPDEEVAKKITAGAGHARHMSGMVTALRALERATRLSQMPMTRFRFLIDAASCAWQAGRPSRAEALEKQVPCSTEDPYLFTAGGLLQGVVAYTSVNSGIARGVLLDRTSQAALVDPSIAAHLLLLAARVELSSGNRRNLRAIGRQLSELSLDPDHPARLFGEALKRLADKDLRQSGSVDISAVGLLRSLLAGEPTVWPAVLPHLPAMGGTAREAFAQAFRDLRSQGATGVLPLLAVSLLALEHFFGDWDDAEALGKEALLLANRLGQRAVAAEVQAMLALIAGARGQSERCRSLVDEALGNSSPREDHLTYAIAHWALGRAAMSTGDPHSAILHYSRVTSPKDNAYHYVISFLVSADLIECHVTVGQTEEAGKVLEQAQEWKLDSGAPHLLGPMLRARALLAADSSQCERLLSEAIAGSKGSLFEQGRAELLLGKRLRREKRIQDARRHLHSAVGVFTSLRAAPWLDQAAAELRSTGYSCQADSGDVPGCLSSLTPQELRVAQMASQGLTNPEIARRLSISSSTIRYHLSKIFQKLNITSRRQLLQADLFPRA